MENNRFFPEIHGKFGFGCMRLPMKGEEVDLEQFSSMVDHFLQQVIEPLLEENAELIGEQQELKV